MEAIHKAIDIDGSVDRVFAYADDPVNTPEWLPSMMEVHNVNGEGVGARHERRAARTKGGMRGLWTFVLEHREGRTHVDVTVEHKIPMPALGRLAERRIVRRNEHEIALAVESINDQCEG